MSEYLVPTLAFLLAALFLLWLAARFHAWLMPGSQEENDALAAIEIELEIEETPYYHRGFHFHLSKEADSWHGYVYKVGSQEEYKFGPYADPYEARRGVEDEIDLLETK